jgi:hypothetical protein
MSTKVSSLTPITPPDSADIIYIVRPSLTISGSKKISLNDLLSVITKGIADKALRIEQTTAPSAGTQTAVIYFDQPSSTLKVSENNGAFRDVVLADKTQTLTGKTLVLPTIGNFTSANHDHHSLATGGPITDVPVTLTDVSGGNVTSDLGTGLNNFIRLPLIGSSNSRTLVAPSNPVDAQIVLWEIKQSGTGSNALTLAGGTGGFILGTDITSTTLSTAANTTDYMTTVYNATAQKHRVIGFLKGY